VGLNGGRQPGTSTDEVLSLYVAQNPRGVGTVILAVAICVCSRRCHHNHGWPQDIFTPGWTWLL